jgi:superfamily II RNA helicase
MKLTETDTPMPAVEPAFLCHYDFPLDDFQVEAIAHFRGGQSVMVAAPTSSGKTVVAEYALWRTLASGKRAIYTTPIKALSNQKRRDLERFFPGQVGLLTGDRSENRDAPVVVMTTEVLRNMLIEDPRALEGVACVVFDEVHYIADPDRGTIWEESIISCLPEIQLVCLSATMANAEEIAEWISQTHRPIALVRHDERPVPLEHYSFTGGALRLLRNIEGNPVKAMPSERRSGRSQFVGAEPGDVVNALRRVDLLPAIWFAFSRQGVEDDARTLANANPPVEGERREAIENAIAWTLSSMPREDRDLPQLSNLMEFLRRGVGFHHAGLLPPCKELVEDLFLRGHLSVVCATDTLAVGINMPARTVVISSLSRPVGGLLTSNDFSQLTGRAGRRGIDSQGAVVMLPSFRYDFARAYASVTGALEPIQSAFNLRYSTLLSLFGRKGAEDRLASLVRSSLRQFQLYREAREAERELHALDEELSALPPLATLVGREEELDEYLAIQGQLSAAQKAHLPVGRGRHGRHAGKRRRRAGAREDALRQLMEEHPLHEVAQDPGFQVEASGRMGLLRRRNRLLRTIEGSRRERDRDAKRTAHAVSTVLRRLGYVDDRGLRPKARGLREMQAAGGIVLSEMYHRGDLSDLTPAELAEVLSWFASDADRRRYNSFSLPPDLEFVRASAQVTHRRVSGLEEGQGIRLAQGPSTWFWGVALAWCQGASIADIVPSIQLGEGDVVSILNKTVDLLDQFRSLLTAYDDQKMLRKTADAKALLMRGLVAALRSETAIVIEDQLQVV